MQILKKEKHKENLFLYLVQNKNLKKKFLNKSEL